MTKLKLKMLKPRIKTLDPFRGIKMASVKTSWRDGKTTTERGYGYKWQQARERFLYKHPLCCYCERAGRVTTATIVDHIEPHRGDEVKFWNESNWQPLCKPCHDREKAREESV